jgi:hypothetical protein
MAFLFDVFFELAKILSFIFTDTVSDSKRVGSMVKASWAKIAAEMATASKLDIIILGAIVAIGFFFAIRFAKDNFKTLLMVFAAIVAVFFFLVLLL